MNCKPLTKYVNLTAVSIHPMGWDTYVENAPVDVYAIGDYYHTIGGQYNLNNLYSCPRGVTPSVDNLMPFDGNPVNYSIQVEERSYVRRNSVNSYCCITIFRNGKPFYSFPANDMAWGFAKAYTLLRSNIEEGPIDFNRQNFLEKEILGRHIMYKGQEYVIRNCEEDLSNGIVILPIQFEKYVESCPDVLDTARRVDIFSENIDWWPSK